MSKSNKRRFLVRHRGKERVFRASEFVEVTGLLLVLKGDGKFRRLASTAKLKFLSLVVQQGETMEGNVFSILVIVVSWFSADS